MMSVTAPNNDIKTHIAPYCNGKRNDGVKKSNQTHVRR